MRINAPSIYKIYKVFFSLVAIKLFQILIINRKNHKKVIVYSTLNLK
jgi:hypothetical protein